VTGQEGDDGWREPAFDTSVGAMGQNVRDAQHWLDRALAESARRYGFEQTDSLRKRFFSPPLSVQEFGLGPRYPNEGKFKREEIAPMGWPWAQDQALALAIFDFQLPEDTKWEDLTKPQRRRAKDLAEFVMAPNRDARKGRPIDTDVPLLLYLMFLIEETTGQKIQISRRKEVIEGSIQGAIRQPPAGEAFALLLRAAYAQTSARLDVEPSKAETVYKLVRVACSAAFRKRFDDLMGRYVHAGLLAENARPADFVAAQPSECRLLLTSSRRNA
jgi:hypothetical protein